MGHHFVLLHGAWHRGHETLFTHPAAVASGLIPALK